MLPRGLVFAKTVHDIEHASLVLASKTLEQLYIFCQQPEDPDVKFECTKRQFPYFTYTGAEEFALEQYLVDEPGAYIIMRSDRTIAHVGDV